MEATIVATEVSGWNQYGEFQETPFPWMAKIPSHWFIRKVGYFFQATKGKRGQQLTKEYCAVNSGSYPVYSGQTEDEGVMGFIDDFEFDYSEDGVLFSTTVGAKAMHVKLLQGKFSLSQNCMILWPNVSGFFVPYFYHLFQTLFAYERAMIPEHMQASFRMEDLYGFRICLPPLPEQRAIAAFLDRETARIDAMIGHKQRLIALLEEKRQAVISHAVTKGLDPNIETRSSGVEWVEKVPQPWTTCALKYTWRQCDYGLSDSLGGVGEIRVLTMGNVRDGLVEIPQHGAWNDVPDEMLVVDGDLLYNRTNSQIHVGKVGLFRELPGVRVSFASYLVRLRFNARADAKYMSYFLNSGGFLKTAQSIAFPSINQSNLNPTRYGALKVTLPPIEEQRRIVLFLENELNQLSELANK